MLLADGSWLRGFYDYRVNDALDHVATFSVTYRYPSASGSGTVTVAMDTPPGALYRWPPESIPSNPPHAAA
jgi:hypothetical protein